MKRLTKTRSRSTGTELKSPRSKRQGIASVRGGASRRSPATAKRGSEQGSEEAREIPRAQWSRFFDTFSKNHDGWMTRVEVVSKGRRGALEARDLPLQGIAVDLKGSSPDTTFIILDMRPNVHLTHSVPRTKQVTFNERKQQLQISAANGDKAIANFKAPRKKR